MQVETADESNGVVDETEEQGVGEASDQGATGATVQDWVGERSRQDPVDGRTHFP